MSCEVASIPFQGKANYVTWSITNSSAIRCTCSSMEDTSDGWPIKRNKADLAV